ncbi:MAG: hypothetical protein OCD01_10195 [Fibrobacterales bacterium]
MNFALWKKIVLLTLPVFVVHLLLRIAQLGRADAYGNPFVGKFSWYIFHAISFDWIWIFGLNMCIAVIVILFRARNSFPWATLGVHALIILLTILDNEIYRFLGGHFNFNMLSTYGNGASFAMIIEYLKEDMSIPYFQLILLPGSIVLLWFFSKKTLRYAETHL